MSSGFQNDQMVLRDFAILAMAFMLPLGPEIKSNFFLPTPLIGKSSRGDNVDSKSYPKIYFEAQFDIQTQPELLESEVHVDSKLPCMGAAQR